MFQLAKQKDVPGLIAYFEQDLKNCLYSYIDLKKYGLENPHLHIYFLEKDGRITATATEYYKGIQVFSCEEEPDLAAICDLAAKLDTPMINGRRELIEALYPMLQDTFTSEYGYVARMPKLNEGADMSMVEGAGPEACLEIAQLICSDEDLGGHYDPKEFAGELIERQKDGFGRNYVLKEAGRIVCHAATYAELDNLAIVSGVICDAACRGRGLGSKVVSALCRDLLKEGKQPCLFFFKKEAAGLYKKVGFEEPTGWGKLSRRKEEE